MPFIYTPAEYELAPEGEHPAYCTRITDLGSHVSNFDGKLKRRLSFIFQLAIPERRESGEPHRVRRTVNYSWHPTSSMTEMLTDWRGGKKMTKADIGQFDLANVLGAKCIVTVEHTMKNDREYANIIAIAPARGAAFEPMHDEPQLLSLEPGEFKTAIFDGLSEKDKEMIKESPQYKKLMAMRNGSEPPKPAPRAEPELKPNPPTAHTSWSDELDDEIPF